ncbi:hypothetical protein FDECE_17323 [Fusarium decemcellulare]|nr:hypothetical protein FDECE_17323 [Fusarium decemcellulare]
MAPQPHPYGDQQQQQQQPPPYGYYPPYQANTQTHVVAAPPPIRRRYPRANFVVVTARQFSLIIPGIIVILCIWWSIREEVCSSDAPVGHPCSWVLWTSLPIAAASCIWSIAMNISGRRASHHMSHIPPPVNATVQLLLALGATACFVLLVYHMETYEIWSRYAEGGMVALLAILMVINWILFGWTMYEITLNRRERQHANSQIPI